MGSQILIPIKNELSPNAMSTTIDKYIIVTFSIANNPQSCHPYMFISESYSSNPLLKIVFPKKLWIRHWIQDRIYRCKVSFNPNRCKEGKKVISFSRRQIKVHAHLFTSTMQLRNSCIHRSILAFSYIQQR